MTMVSIHARHFWRASPYRPAICFGIPRFNPRPSFLAGEPRRHHRGPVGKLVSIHARHFWRASPCMARDGEVVIEFQSTPVISGGRARLALGYTSRRVKFQSTPVISGGRAFRADCG